MDKKTDPQPEKKRLPRKEFAADVRLETLAVREGLPASAWGEHSEALFLTSSFVHPDAATAAATARRTASRSRPP
ncbi:MAG: hypothetical protein V4532_06540, partial [Pseudomonadota bacterium]